MTLSDKNELLYAAYDADDVGEFARLLAVYPECRYPDSGDDLWMSAAAADGKLWAVRLFVSQGADLIKPANSTDSTPAPEGPLANACESGNVELVRYMLDLGVPVNHTVDGRSRCFALTSAATRGRLEVVKLLVERGAEVNAAWTPWTALDYAANYRNADVVDYLRSVGGKSGDELRRSAGER